MMGGALEVKQEDILEKVWNVCTFDQEKLS